MTGRIVRRLAACGDKGQILSSSIAPPKRHFEAAARGIGPNNLRQNNQRAVLSGVAVAPGCSNADISRRTGLAPQSVSAVLADLEEMGLIYRGKARRGGGRGQPATPFFIDPAGAYAIGVELGWSHLEVALVSIETRIIDRRRWSHDYPDARTIFTDIRKAVADLAMLVPQRQQDRIVGIGLAVPNGLGDAGSLTTPPDGQRELWSRIDVAAEVAAATGFDVHLVNDGSAACWAEFVALPPPRPGNFVYLLIDTFVGAGIVAEDRLWEGITGDSANLGAMLVTDRQGTPHFVHELASLSALRRRLGTLDLLSAIGASAPAATVAIVDAWIEDASFALAQAILLTRTVLEFDFAVVEAELPPALRQRLVHAIARNLPAPPSLLGTRPGVVEGHIGRSGAAQGAAFIRIYRRFFSRELAHIEA